MTVEVIYVGGKSFITIRKEVTYGTYDGAGTDEKWVLGTNFTNPRKNNMIRLYALGGGRNYVQAVAGKYEVDGTLEYNIQNGSLLHYALGNRGSWAWATGTWTRTAGTATPTYHPAYDLDGTAITGAPTALNLWHVREADVLDPFSMDQLEYSSVGTDLKIRYLGCKVNQFTLSVDTEKPPQVTFDWIGRTESLETEGIITEPVLPGAFTDPVPMFYQGTLFIGGTAPLPIVDTLAAAETAGPCKITTPDTVIACNSIESRLTHNLEKYFSINNSSGRGTQYLLEKQREYSLTLDLNFVNADQLKRFYNGVATTVAPTGPLSCVAYSPFMVAVDFKTCQTAGDNFKQIRFVFSNVYFDETSIPVNPTDIVKQTVNAIAKRCDVYYITNEAQQ